MTFEEWVESTEGLKLVIEHSTAVTTHGLVDLLRAAWQAGYTQGCTEVYEHKE